MERFDCAIVGAGLGGLLCAAGLAQRGKRVVVLERAARAGGRARSQITGGFVLNQGPHAVYRGGATEALLTELGVPLSAGLATARGGVLVSSEGTHAFPRGALSLLGTSALGLRGKVQVARVLAGLGEARRRLEPQISVAAWLTSLGLEPRAERVMRALCRLATYVDAPDELSAQAAAIALHAATAGGVLYVHAGWQSIVDGLTAELRDAEVRFGASVRRVVTQGDQVRGVELASGELVGASSVVIAAGPRIFGRLVAEIPQLRAAAARAADARPVRAYCRDVALSEVPRPNDTFALGLDHATYASLHSATAVLAPAGGGVLHLAHYLRPSESADSEVLAARLHAVAEALQPGYARWVHHERTLPNIIVCNDFPRADCGGLAGRVPGSFAELRGLAVVGDWVGAEGLLIDAVAASARAAIEALAPSGLRQVA